MVLLQATIDLRSSFDLSVSHLGVLLHGETLLHGFHVEVDRWDGRDNFAKLQLTLPLLDICIGSCVLRGTGWLQLSSVVFFLVLRLCLGRNPLVRFACRWLCSSCLPLAMLLSCLLLAMLFCLLLAMLFSVLFIIAPDHRCSSRAVLVLLLLYFILLTTCSLAVVPSLLPLQSHFVVVCDSVVRFWLLPTPLLSIAPLRD